VASCSPGPCSIACSPWAGAFACLIVARVGFLRALCRHGLAYPDPFFRWASGTAGAWITKMATEPRRPRLSPKARRALEMLACRPFGATERLMLARGFSRRMLLGLVKQRLAIVTYEIVRPDRKTLETGKMQITAAGRNALSGED
jgi:hypothetical protein